MTEILIDILKDIPPQIATLIIAMIPIGELRASIPVALGVYNLSHIASYIYSVIGNMIPVVAILLIFDPISKWLMKKFSIFNRIFNWLFEKTRTRHTKKFERWGTVALITLVAIPLPLTGGYTGALAAYLFGVPFKKAFPLIFVGVLIAGIIVTIISTGIYNVI